MQEARYSSRRPQCRILRAPAWRAHGASVKSGACTISFGEQRIEGRIGADSPHSRMYRRARPVPTAARNRVSVPPEGFTVPSASIFSMLMRSWIATAARLRDVLLLQADIAQRIAARQFDLRATRSMPVISSVTVCSTCRRGLASMKANAGVCRVGLRVHQKFERSRARAASHRRPATPPRRSSCLAQVGIEAWGGRDLDDLLMAALERAVALPDMARGLAVARHLHLDMPRIGHERFDIDSIIAEARLRFGPAARIGFFELRRRR